MSTETPAPAKEILILVQRNVPQTDPNDVEAVLSLLSTGDLKAMLRKANLGIPKNKADMVTRLAEYPGTEVKLNIKAAIS